MAERAEWLEIPEKSPAVATVAPIQDSLITGGSPQGFPDSSAVPAHSLEEPIHLKNRASGILQDASSGLAIAYRSATVRAAKSYTDRTHNNRGRSVTSITSSRSGGHPRRLGLFLLLGEHAWREKQH